MVQAARRHGLLPLHAAPASGIELRADASFRLSRGEGVFLEQVPLDVTVPAPQTTSDGLLFSGKSELLLTTNGAKVEELRWVHEPVARHVARYRVTLGPGLAELVLRDGRFLAVAHDGRVRFASEPLVAVDASGAHRQGEAKLTREEGAFVIETSFELAGATFPVMIDPAWSAAGDMALTFRIKPVAMPMADGRVIVAGGYGFTENPLSSSEIFDPKTNGWSAGPNLPRTMKDPAVVPLGGFKYLLGCDYPDGSSTVLFDGNTGTFTSAGTIPGGTRFACAMAPLPGGSAIVAGGLTGTATPMATTYTWTAPSTWTASTALPAARGRASAAALGTGEVLLADGNDSTGSPAKEVWIFDPTKSTWSSVAALTTASIEGAMAAVTGGALLVDKTGAHYFDRTANSWKHFTEPARSFATILPFGARFLVAAGAADLADRKTFLFDATAQTFSAGPSLVVGRGPAGNAVLPGAGILLAGGTFSSLAERLGKTPGDACGADAECATGHCIDGLCCNAVCDGQCEACDVPGALGICYPVRGAPHGKRTACNDGSTDPCLAATCDGTVDTKKCAAFTKGAETTCKPTSCTGASFAAESKCNGLGACVTPTAVSCAPFACGATGCKATCATAADCADGFDCRAGRCVAFEHTCSEDKLTSIPKQGTPEKCAPFLCGTDGLCMKTCATSADCQSGSVCDTAVKSCIPATAPPDDGGGCSASPHASNGALALVTLALLGLSRRRRDQEVR